MWTLRLPFKCEETLLCGISIYYFILSSVECLLPVTPSATITCHPSRQLSLSVSSTARPPLLSSSATPLFSPFCRGFPPIQVHTSQVPARPYACLPSLRGVAVVTARMDDRQGPVPLSSSHLSKTTHIAYWPSR